MKYYRCVSTKAYARGYDAIRHYLDKGYKLISYAYWVGEHTQPSGILVKSFKL